MHMKASTGWEKQAGFHLRLSSELFDLTASHSTCRPSMLPSLQRLLLAKLQQKKRIRQGALTPHQHKSMHRIGEKQEFT